MDEAEEKEEGGLTMPLCECRHCGSEQIVQSAMVGLSVECEECGKNFIAEELAKILKPVKSASLMTREDLFTTIKLLAAIILPIVVGFALLMWLTTKSENNISTTTTNRSSSISRSNSSSMSDEEFHKRFEQKIVDKSEQKKTVNGEQRGEQRGGSNKLDEFYREKQRKEDEQKTKHDKEEADRKFQQQIDEADAALSKFVNSCFAIAIYAVFWLIYLVNVISIFVFGAWILKNANLRGGSGFLWMLFHFGSHFVAMIFSLIICGIFIDTKKHYSGNDDYGRGAIMMSVWIIVYVTFSLSGWFAMATYIYARDSLTPNKEDEKTSAS